MGALERLLTKFLQAVIRLYALAVSPWLGRNCRFHPTCSSYAHRALERHGTGKGLVLAVKRIFKCHPWSKAEWNDPVPPSIAWRDLLGYKREAPKNSAACEADAKTQKQ